MYWVLLVNFIGYQTDFSKQHWVDFSHVHQPLDIIIFHFLTKKITIYFSKMRRILHLSNLLEASISY